MSQIKSRAEMDPRYLWHLNDIISDTEEFNTLFAQAEDRISEFAKFKGSVSADPLAALRHYFDTEKLLEKIFVYARMKSDEDGDNSDSQALVARAAALMNKAQEHSAFLKPELLSMDESTLRNMAQKTEYSDFSVYLNDLLRARTHTLPYEQEMLLAMTGEVLEAPDNAFTMLNDVEIPMLDVTNEDGQKVQLTHGNFGSLIRSGNRDVRAEAFRGMHNAYKDFASTITALYGGSVKGDIFRSRARRFDSSLEAALYPDEIPTEVYQNLISAVHDALPDLARYLNLRKKALNLPELHLYDLYVPMVADVDMKIEYEDAFLLVKDALKPLGDDYQLLLDQAHDNGWIDVYENKSKHSGAYSWGCYGVHPYVLLNFEPGLDGASTLAHELGHAMHTHYSNNAQCFEKSGYSLFVAEVASTCNEVLLSRYQTNKYQDNKKLAAYLLNDLLESFRTTLFRQTMFAEFEMKAHEMAERGEPLTRDSLSNMYKALNEQYYGAGCVIDDEIAAEWMRIPHFYSAFYVYKYATGFSAAVAIASRILNEGESAVRDYKKFLSAGGSMSPIEALRLAGVDMASPVPVREALKVFADTVTELEKLL